VAGVSGDRQQGGHPDLGPELRALAQAILDRIDPAVRTAAALAATSASEGPGPCQQVWCPVCALAAVVSGQEHPLLTVIAEHSTALLAVVRAMVDGPESGDGPDGPPDGGGPGGGGDDTPTGPQSPGRYQHIPVTVED
jgi:hypothetical protein